MFGHDLSQPTKKPQPVSIPPKPGFAGRYVSVISLIAVGLVGVSAAGGCSVKQKVRTVWAIEGGLKIHSVDARSITAMSDRSFIVVGGDTLQNLRAWAVRVESSGHVRWEFLDGGGSDSRDNRFFEAVELPGGVTMLCGVKTIDSKPTAFIDRVNAKGELLEEHPLKPVGEGYAGSIQCFRWGDGVALLTGLSRTQRATGWLIKVDIEGKVQWDKYGDVYSATDHIETPGNQLLVCDLAKRP
jgi:hypothetical protein